MTRWKRFGLSFASAIIADALVAAWIMLHSQHRIDLAQWMYSWIAFLILVIPGWFVSLPVIFLIEVNSRTKLIVLAGIGILIGPFVILCISLYGAWKNPSEGVSMWTPESMVFGYVATAISVLSTALYLTGLKLFSHPIPTQSSGTK